MRIWHSLLPFKVTIIFFSFVISIITSIFIHSDNCVFNRGIPVCENFADPIITGFLGQPCVDPCFLNIESRRYLLYEEWEAVQPLWCPPGRASRSGSFKDVNTLSLWEKKSAEWCWESTNTGSWVKVQIEVSVASISHVAVNGPEHLRNIFRSITLWQTQVVICLKFVISCNEADICG